MGKLEVPPGWVCQAYRFEVDRPSRHPSISSHEGGRRFAWNWARTLIEDQLHARETFRVLALRQGATLPEAEEFATGASRIPYLVEMNEQRVICQSQGTTLVASNMGPPQVHSRRLTR